MQLAPEEQSVVEKNFQECISEMESKAIADIGKLNSAVNDCANEINGITTSTMAINEDLSTDSDVVTDDNVTDATVTFVNAISTEKINSSNDSNASNFDL